MHKPRRYTRESPYNIFAHNPRCFAKTYYIQADTYKSMCFMVDLLFKNRFSVYVYSSDYELLDKILQKNDTADENKRIERHNYYKKKEEKRSLPLGVTFDDFKNVNLDFLFSDDENV